MLVHCVTITIIIVHFLSSTFISAMADNAKGCDIADNDCHTTTQDYCRLPDKFPS
jgi:hypothetical protein